MSNYVIHENISILKGTPLVLVTSNSEGKLGIYDKVNNVMVASNLDFVFPEKDGKVMTVKRQPMIDRFDDISDEMEDIFSLISWNGGKAIVLPYDYESSKQNEN